MWDGPERREMQPCKFEDKIIEMHGDIKCLLSEFKAMNGKLYQTKTDMDDHKKESEIHRYRITVIWFIMQGIKWAVGGGILTTLIMFLLHKRG